ncbi:MAG: hypothetical protein JWN52_2662 [Actinomycetia bacterium]|nr:hypothetical protein [Actinomycetes bacterium]
MGSLLEELARREAAARRRAEQIRQQIAELSQRLAAEDELVSRLLITRETVEQVLDEAGQPTESPREEPDSGPARSQGSPIGVLTVPPWRPGMDGSVLPQAYRDVLEVLMDAGKPLRAGHLAAALGLGEGAATGPSTSSKNTSASTRPATKTDTGSLPDHRSPWKGSAPVGDRRVYRCAARCGGPAAGLSWTAHDRPDHRPRDPAGSVLSAKSPSRPDRKVPAMQSICTLRR